MGAAGDSGRGGQSGSYIAAGSVSREAASARAASLDAGEGPAPAAGRLGRGDQPGVDADPAVGRRHRQEDRRRHTARRAPRRYWRHFLLYSKVRCEVCLFANS